MHLIMRIQPCVVSPRFIVSAFLLSETLKNLHIIHITYISVLTKNQDSIKTLTRCVETIFLVRSALYTLPSDQCF